MRTAIENVSTEVGGLLGWNTRFGFFTRGVHLDVHSNLLIYFLSIGSIIITGITRHRLFH